MGTGTIQSMVDRVLPSLSAGSTHFALRAGFAHALPVIVMGLPDVKAPAASGNYADLTGLYMGPQEGTRGPVPTAPAAELGRGGVQVRTR